MIGADLGGCPLQSLSLGSFIQGDLMKLFGCIAAAVLCLSVSGEASAKTVDVEKYTTVKDPTGVAMCFDQAGKLAPLANCQLAYVTRLDPAGGVMCFATNGKLAPLAKCRTRQADGSPRVGLVARIARLR